MSNPGAILDGLTQIARQHAWIAIWWHAVVGTALIALLAGWRPSKRLAAVLLTVPLISVAIIAGLHGNPFNASVLGAGALVLLGLAARLSPRDVEGSSVSVTALGLALIAFGWVYPHFLSDQAGVVYLYAAPLGSLPCPTLAAIIGLALLGRGYGGRAWATLLACLGLFYGSFGTLRLGVTIDLFLTAGALALLGLVWLDTGISLHRLST